jgi:small subunit ribosomal protein S15
MSLTAEEKQQLVCDFGHNEADTGSPRSQIAVLTAQIRSITAHLKTHPKDFSSRRGLLGMVSRRRKLLDFLKRTAPNEYVEMLSRLQIRK